MNRYLALAISSALVAGPALSQNVQISGFGQIVGATLTDGDSFPTNGITDDWDFSDESLFALQVRGDLNEQWSATAQIVANGRDDFDPEFSWAYVSWKSGNGLALNLGRQRIPFYRYSDFLQVGYAYPWIRPPAAVYNFPFANFDGANLTYSRSSGNWFTTYTVVAGQNEDSFEIAGLPARQKADSLVGVIVDVSNSDSLSVRASYLQADVLIDADIFSPLISGLRGAGLAPTADAIEFNDKSTFFGLSAEYNAGPLFLAAEYTDVSVDDSYFTDKTQYYVTAGYRLGVVIPHITYGKRTGDARLEVLSLIPASAQTNALRDAARGLLASDDVDATFSSVGIRWDVGQNVALKADFTRYENEGLNPDDADLVSAGVTFTF